MNNESIIVASRGRNPENPADRTPGTHVEQRLEPNSEGICNTLTTVQKDNMLLESCDTEIIKIKQATKDGYIECDLGGGVRHGISRKHNTQRESTGGRTGKSDIDGYG